MFGVILAQGSGNQLWPLSREFYPEQFVNLTSEKSLLQTSFELLNTIIPSQNIINVVNDNSKSVAMMQLDKICKNPIILSESVSGISLSAMVLAVKQIIELTPKDEVVLVIPSDIFIKDKEGFIKSIEFAQKFVEENKIVLMGHGSGIYMFKVSTIIEELKKYSLENLLGKSDKLLKLELQTEFERLSSWETLCDISSKDENKNVFIGQVLDNGSKNSFVYSSSKLVATIGLEDMVIIESEDAILACKKDRTQEVKQVYDILRQQKNPTQKVHKTVYRPWGYYTVIAEGKGFQTKIIHVNIGQKLSVQSHNYRSEHWVILSGTAKVVLDGKDYILTSGQSIDIPLKAIHSLQNPYEDELEIIEVQKGDILSEDDIIRYEDMYGRV